MSKLALINRNEKRKKLVVKFAKKRDLLQAIVDDPKASEETRYAARLKIQALPRNSKVRSHTAPRRSTTRFEARLSGRIKLAARFKGTCSNSQSRAALVASVAKP